MAAASAASAPDPAPPAPPARPRRLLRGLAWAVAAAVLAPLVFHGWVHARRDLGAMFAGIERLESRTAGLERRARDYDPEAALAAIGRHPANGFVWRLDEDLERFRAVRPEGARALDAAPLVSIGFDPGEPVSLVSRQGTSTIEGGVLSTVFHAGDVLETRGEFSIDPDDVAELVLRVRHARGAHLSLGWARGGEAENQETLTLFPIHGEFHEYRIQTESLFQDTSFPFVPVTDEQGRRAPIQKLLLVPSDVEGDEIAIDKLELVSKRAKFAQATHGTDHRRAGNDLRRVVYANAPLTLTGALDLPPEPVWLELGLSVLASGDPVRFTVRVSADGRASEVLDETVADPRAWRDRRVDLSAWSGKRIDLAFAAESAGGNVAFLANPTVHGAPQEKRNVLLLLEDAQRADRHSGAGHRRNTTPRKDQLAREGVRFLACYSQESKTRMSVPSMMTSLLPTATGVWNFQEVLHENYVTLAEILRAQGFETVAILQNPNAGAGAGLHQGFSESIELERGTPRADEAWRAARAWIERHPDRNLFLYVHVLDPHSPYDPPPPFDAWARESLGVGPRVKALDYYDPSWDPEPTRESRRARYDGEIAYDDACFGEFWDWFGSTGRREDTLFLQVSDHGEFLGERGMWDHHPPGFAPVVHVPLILRLPGRLTESPRGDGAATNPTGAGLEIAEPVALLDVLPTILDVLGTDASPLLLQGDSLLAYARGASPEPLGERVVISDEVIDRAGKHDERSLASVFFRDLQVINSANFSSKRPLHHFLYARTFDLARGSIEDPPEADLAWDPIFRWRLGRAVGELQRASVGVWLGLTKGVGGSMEYDPETIERLKKLGYL